VIAESWGQSGLEAASVTYERDPVTSIITGMTVMCPDRTGRPLPHSSHVKPSFEEWTKWDLIQTHCSWSEWSRRRQAGKRDREPQ
jgi:hypothetical protein